MELNNTEMKMQYILDENKNLAEIPLTDMRPVEHPIKYKLVSAFEVFVRVLHLHLNIPPDASDLFPHLSGLLL